jgi:hypothetical protein
MIRISAIAIVHTTRGKQTGSRESVKNQEKEEDLPVLRT